MPPNFETPRDEIYWKFGRNVVLLQKIEYFLKLFVSRQNLSISVNINNPDNSSPKHQVKQRNDLVAHKTLGNIRKQFCDEVLASSTPHPQPEITSKNETRLTWSFHPFVGNDAACKEFEDRLSSIVNDRNQLIHQIFTIFNFNEAKELDKFITFLDQLHGKSSSLLHDLHKLHKRANKALEKITYLADSPLPREELKEKDIQLVIVNLILRPIFHSKSRFSPWVNLSEAGIFIRTHCLENFIESKKLLKAGSLKKFILKTEIFDLKTQKNSDQYRLKPEYFLDIDHEGTINFCKKSIDTDKTEIILSEELKIFLSKDAIN